MNLRCMESFEAPLSHWRSSKLRETPREDYSEFSTIFCFICNIVVVRFL